MRITNIKNKLKDKRGLTLIELIVAIGVFGLVVSMAFGIFVLAIVSQRRIIALRNVEDNARFALESMAREIRTGKNFSGGAGSLSFTNAKGELVIYRLNGGIVEKSSDGGANYSAVTGSETTVNYLNFYLMGQAPGDGLQPRITVTMGVASQVGNQSANLKVQTTISGRFLQI
ncbi:MAG: type II secretion system protein [Candidatus Azambacteria bacterium]|nr:type II secretion system protein [Candidatus Azambacteria bacterium]